MDQKKWSLDNFEVELLKTDEGVFLQAEDQIQRTIFSKQINSESVKSISADPFFDLDTFYQLLKDFFEKKPENTSLSISCTGKLHYSSQFLFVTIVKKFEFEFQFDKQEFDPVTKLTNQVNKLSDKILKLEAEKNTVANTLQNFEKVFLEKFEKLEKVLTKFDERITLLEKGDERVPHVKKSDERIFQAKKSDNVEILQCEFDLTPEIVGFQLSNNSKTALSHHDLADSIFSKQSIPKLRKSKFSFLLRKTFWVKVGLATERQFNTASFAYSNDGKFYLNQIPTGKYSKYKEGDQVSFTCDMTTGLIEVALNDTFIGSHTIPKDQLDSQTFYPFLYTNGNAGAGATFI